MMGEGRIHTKGKKVGHCRVSQRLLSMIVVPHDLKTSKASHLNFVKDCKAMV